MSERRSEPQVPPHPKSLLDIMVSGFLLCFASLLLLGLVRWPVAKQVAESDIHLDFMSRQERLRLREAARRMFYFGYNSYMKYAFPEDELDPIHCTGRGSDKADPSNININDVLGDYSLSLIESLDTLAIMGNTSEFKRAVSLVLSHTDFNKNNTIQVFEATIRVLGGLLSAHLMAIDPTSTFGNLLPENYDNELLHLAHDLGSRLLSAFENSSLGIPHPRVNLQSGLPSDGRLSTCTAAAGTLLVEFGVLSHLLDDPVFELRARRAVAALWQLRSSKTGLLSDQLRVDTGAWLTSDSSVGAGIDSFYEYLLKAYILFGDENDLVRFNAAYRSVMTHIRQGSSCNSSITPDEWPPFFANVDMHTGHVSNTWIDSLSAAFPAVQVLNGDLEEAICNHALYYTIWRRFGALPERFNWQQKRVEVAFYPLRPELVESTYLLYQATKNPFYLQVGREILDSLNEFARAECGYATLHDVEDKSQEDRMESFFLSETAKYLYLLFDEENVLNREAEQFIFSTEGHPFRLNISYHRGRDYFGYRSDVLRSKGHSSLHGSRKARGSKCSKWSQHKEMFLPLSRRLLGRYEDMVGIR